MTSQYGLWFLVVVNTALVIVFAASFYHPGKNRRDWVVMGGFSAFVVALFAEMYGAPLTVYVLAGWLGTRFPLLRADHAGGHILNDLVGWSGEPHLSPFHLASYVLIGGGFWLVSAAWRVLHGAVRSRSLATAGAYASVRHPQYLGFLLVMAGFLLEWPTIPTVAMFPVLAVVYARLARSEERQAQAEFGDAWRQYARRVPAFVPHLPQHSRETYLALPHRRRH